MSIGLNSIICIPQFLNMARNDIPHNVFHCPRPMIAEYAGIISKLYNIAK